MRQYAAVKKEHPNALVFFRLGDFYELFFEDAVVASHELQITLTSRNKEKGIAIPMCGVPYHSAEGYIAKLIRKGFKVAICEQMEDPRIAKNAGEARSHTRADPGHRGRRASRLGGKQFPGLRGAGRKCRWLCRARSLDRRISRDRVSGRRCRAPRARGIAGACVRAKCCSPRRCRSSISHASSASAPVAGCCATHHLAGKCHLGRDSARRLGVLS